MGRRPCLQIMYWFYPETKKWKHGGIAEREREVLFLQLDLLLWPQHSVHNDASSKILFKNSHNFHSWAPRVPIRLPFRGGNVSILSWEEKVEVRWHSRERDRSLFLQLDLLLWPQHSVQNDVSSKFCSKIPNTSIVGGLWYQYVCSLKEVMPEHIYNSHYSNGVLAMFTS